ncbi:hypothetical protein K466DRAFT_654782 [Polyporus arcularius HHB13444]|uniref:DUF4470 domain-containing protein n=1 Tax=Polyporus arcularius HHB13444 TaxID=1314778 RepID=A0A5C3P700_9APHY|nr:hypothetical protein K466DRAFT_654782 [Polyporus arcularius HHB13444]
MSQDASALKERGNELFKARKMSEAASYYEKAEKADPSSPVYPSNLSAALYEAGDYLRCVDAVLRSWKLLETCPEAQPDLVAKLSIRLAKALCHGVSARAITHDLVTRRQDEICKLQDCATKLPAQGKTKKPDEDFTRVWDEWIHMESDLKSYDEKREACLRGFSRLPMFCKPLAQEELYFSIGHDPIIDLTAGWLNHPHPLKIDALPRDKLSELAFLFGGVGDGRHVLATVCGLHAAYKQLSKAKQRSFRAHLTLLDIDHSMLARDLCMLLLLHQLNSTSNTIIRTEIKATLMYTFIGAVMPPYCFERLRTIIGDLRRRLTATPPELPPWLHVVPESIPAIIKTLEHWSTLKKSTSRTLENHRYMSKLNPPDVSRMGADELRRWNMFMTQERESTKEFLHSARDADLVKIGVIPETVPPSRRRGYLLENMESVVDDYQKLYPFGQVRPIEDLWYQELKVLLPPEELRSRHPGFDNAWRTIVTQKNLDRTLRREALTHINEEWKPNVTLFAPKYSDPKRYPGGDGYPPLDADVLETAACIDLFNRRTGPNAHKQARYSIWILASEACGAFFEETAAALKALADRITLEVLCGGLSEELYKMHVKADTARSKEFPRKYTRMWLSNVPDYVHGPMNTIVYNIPNVQDDTQAALAFNCLANVGAFVDDDEYFHTYTLLTPPEIRRYMGCQVMNPRVTTEVAVLRPLALSRPLTELATQDELKTWLTRVLFNTVLPARSKMGMSKVHVPHNLVAFFGLLLYLHGVGYPSHWLCELLARILSGSVHSDIAPFRGEYPMPLSERARRVQPRRVRTDPWLVELETIIATAYYALPFSLAGAIPDDFSRDPRDIVVWGVQVKPARLFSTQSMFNPVSPYDFRTHLLFYRSDLMGPPAVINHLASIFEGKASPAPGTFFILTSQEHVQYETSIRFRLSRRRVEKMRKEKWSMVAYRNDSGHQATVPVAIEHWALIADSDGDFGLSESGLASRTVYESALEELD